MMKVWLIIFDISSQVSNGFAVVSAPNAITAQLTLMTLGNGNLIGYNITGILELGPSHILLVRILTEGITSRGAEGPMGPQGPQGELGALGPTGAPFTFDMFTPQQLELIRGPQGFQGKLGPQGPLGIPGHTPLKGVDYFDGERGPEGKIGPLGPRGLQGPQGILGVKGDKGDLGIQGILGILGPKGDPGELGPIGPQGPKGDAGAVETTDDFYVTTDGKLAINKTTTAEEDNTKPITSGGVYAIVGNIETLLNTI